MIINLQIRSEKEFLKFVDSIKTIIQDKNIQRLKLDHKNKIFEIF